jgi:hypothetical protein
MPQVEYEYEYEHEYEYEYHLIEYEPDPSVPNLPTCARAPAPSFPPDRERVWKM